MILDAPLKKCSKCGESKDVNLFSKDAKGLLGRRSSCKECVNIHAAKYRREKGIPEVPRNELDTKEGIVGKYCTKCNEWKPLSLYHKQRNGLGGTTSACVECRKNIYYDADVRREYNTIWYENNRERKLRKSSEWELRNGEKRRLYDLRRRARKKALPNMFTTEQMTHVLNIFNGGCSLTDDVDIHWDHVIPLATGCGGTIYGNMIPLRSDLNESKGDRNIFEWFEANRQRFNLEQERFDRLISWLGKANGMTVEEYRDYVYECHANPNEIYDATAI
jgi:hypothetical protein